MRKDVQDWSFTGYHSSLCVNARALRKNMTKQERHLWYDFLRDYPIKFYRQRVIDQFVVDFYCSKAKLILELDGSQHDTELGKASDIERTDILQKYHLEVMRFKNEEIDQNFQSVCEKIDQKVKERCSGCGDSCMWE